MLKTLNNGIARRNIQAGLLIVLSIVISGCAASVKYAERIPGFRPGYVDQQLGEHTYQVRIGEAWPKDWHDLEKFAMFRAAEVAQQNGFRYFAVTNSSTRISRYTIAIPQTTTTNAVVSVHGNAAHVSSTSTTTGGGNANISGGWYTLDYRLIAEDDIENYNNVVDSKDVIESLRYFIDHRR
jgi:hypothetical protein